MTNSSDQEGFGDKYDEGIGERIEADSVLSKIKKFSYLLAYGNPLEDYSFASSWLLNNCSLPFVCHGRRKFKKIFVLVRGHYTTNTLVIISLSIVD